MKPTSLRDLIREHRRADDALIVDRSGAWTIAHLDAAATMPEASSAGPADTVAICCRDAMKLLLAILACDGRVGTMLLLPGDLPPDLARALATSIGAGAILTDRGDLTSRDAAACPAREVRSCGGTTRTRWVFATSGTTGTPKLVQHDLQSLTAGLRTGGGTGRRWGQLYDIARFAGTQVMLQALASGVMLLPDREWPLPRTLRFFAAEGCDSISATPTLWRKILMTPEGRELRVEQATLGGEIADGAILSAMRRRFPDARICHVYASTEAGASFAIADGAAGFPVAMLGARRNGPELKVADGRLLIRSDPERRTYLGSDLAYADADGFVDTGDMIGIRGDRCFFLGRANGAINVGGDKLYPQEVEEILLAHADVEHARVYARSNPITGQIVVADVVARPGIGDTRAFTAALRGHCANSLPRWKWPAIFRLVADLEAGSSGKVGRHP
jgi:acyl-CoA synthetase (AMP-forming)/AMP-acid ligase II